MVGQQQSGMEPDKSGTRLRKGIACLLFKISEKLNWIIFLSKAANYYTDGNRELNLDLHPVHMS